MTAAQGAFLLAAALACTGRKAGGDRPPPPEKPRVAVVSGGREHEVVVELARTDAERERGLMFRDHLDRDQGMLFVFDEDSEHTFWMKNTLIPLDMIFIDGLGRIVGIVSRAEPLTLAPRSAPPSRYVLEVVGGWAEEHGVKVGDTVRFRGPVLGP